MKFSFFTVRRAAGCTRASKFPFTVNQIFQVRNSQIGRIFVSLRLPYLCQVRDRCLVVIFVLSDVKCMHLDKSWGQGRRVRVDEVQRHGENQPGKGGIL